MNHPFPPTSPNLGLYVHIPFCLSKCEYCHFASGVFSKEMITPYLSALKQEIEELRVPLEYLNIGKHSISNYQVDSIFFGGGTPSLIDGQEIGKVLQVIRSCFFITDEIITGSTSNATAKVLVDDSRNSRLFITSQQRFITGETITGGTSGS